MANTVDYVPVANGGSADVESQAQYLLDLGGGGSLQFGYKTGTALTAQFNKTIRQCSMMAAAVATFISNTLTIDVLDDGNLANLVTNLANAVLNWAWSTGDVKLTLKAVPDGGWIMANDGTIGSATSGATYANNNAQALFNLIWNNVSDTWAPVVGGRGGSASADWTANKKITLTKMLGRALAISGAGVGLTSRALGQNLGEENHVLSSTEVPATPLTITDGGHSHTTWAIVDSGHAGGAGLPVAGSGAGTSNTGTSTTGITGVVAGGGGGHNTMQPTGFLNAMIKL